MQREITDREIKQMVASLKAPEKESSDESDYGIAEADLLELQALRARLGDKYVSSTPFKRMRLNCEHKCSVCTWCWLVTVLTAHAVRVPVAACQAGTSTQTAY